MKKKMEWSKLLSTVIAFGFGIFAVWCGTEYYALCELAIMEGGIAPDSTLAVTAMSIVIAALMSYLMYQMGLKNSRNKYGVGEDGEPYKIKINEEYEEGGEEG